MHGNNFDLCSKAVLRNLHRDIQKWNVVAAMFGTLCTSFSVARDRTSVIRSREFPYGVPGLSIADAERVSVGNSIVWATVRIVSWLHTCKVPWCIENPHSSKLWYFPEIEELSHAPNVNEVVLDYCQFGAPWRKRTRLILGNCDHNDIQRLCKQCVGHGVCSRTVKPHFQ